MSNRDDDGKDYSVGYKRPPLASRFRKGQSGNRRGRPKKRKAKESAAVPDSATDAILRQELDRLVTVTDRDGTQKMSSLEIVQRSQVKKAIEGSPIAQRDILQASRELERREAQRAQAEQAARRERFERTLRWREYRRGVWEEAERVGREPDDPWPHHDDILVDPQNLTSRVRGPLYERDVPYYRYLEAMRDHHLLEAQLALRPNIKISEAMFEIHAMAWTFYDERLPLRWQIRSGHERLHLGLCTTPTGKLRRLVRECEEEVNYWDKLVYPLGERITFDADVARALKPHVKRLGFASVRAYERHLEEESGNPPSPLLDKYGT